jgi:hypothetical protein
MNPPILQIIDATHIAIDGEVLPVVSTEMATEVWAIVCRAEARIAREKEAAA